jgi:hypothetical protein
MCAKIKAHPLLEKNKRDTLTKMEIRGNRQLVSFGRLESGTTCRRSIPKERESQPSLSNVASVVIANSVPLTGVRRKADTLVRPHCALDAEWNDRA